MLDDVNNIYDRIPTTLPDEVVETLVESGSVRIERIVSKGHASPESGWFDREQSEWVILLKGKAVLVFEDAESANLMEGDYINMPAHRKHRVGWTAPDMETIWLAVHY